MTEISRLFDLLPYYEQNFRPKDDVLAAKERGIWKKYDIKTFHRNVDLLSYAFLKMGIRKGDNIATITGNRPEWNFVDMATMQVGAVHVPIYQTISLDDYAYILQHADIQYIFMSGYSIYQRIEPVLSSLEHLKAVYFFDEEAGNIHAQSSTIKIASWKDLLNLGASHPLSETLEEVKSSIATDDVASIIYTSGTTGTQKGVMISHRGLIANIKGIIELTDLGEDARALSILPLSHIYERMLNYYYLYKGISIYYAESVVRFIENCQEIHPHITCCVPRLLESVYNTILQQSKKQYATRKRLFLWALDVAKRYEPYEAKTWVYECKWRIAYRLILSRYCHILGNQMHLVISGGASLNPDLERFFYAIGITVCEGYGLTETSPVIAVCMPRPKDLKIGMVGRALPGTEMTISSEGEILSRGPHIMKGYYKDAELTKMVIDKQAWFHTGDAGSIDKDGFLRVNGRIRETFKTSAGKWITPQQLESRLCAGKYIQTCLVLGENRKMPGALIIPDFSQLETWCKNNKIPFRSKQQVIRHKRVQNLIKQEIMEVNKSLVSYERIGPFCLLADEWSTISGELSATFKVKRPVVVKKYAAQIQEMFES